MRLDGKIALVTGSSSGTGRAIAVLFADEAADQVLCDLQAESRLPEEVPSTEEMVQARGRRTRFHRCDIASESDVHELLAAVGEVYGRLDILVNCVGIFQRNAIADVTLEEWNRVLTVNLTGYYLTTRAAIPLLLESSGPSIVNVSSIHGRTGTGAAATYSASKGGVENLTRQVAVDHGRRGIRCNAIASHHQDRHVKAVSSHSRTAAGVQDSNPPAAIGRALRRRLRGPLPGVLGILVCDRAQSGGRWRLDMLVAAP